MNSSTINETKVVVKASFWYTIANFIYGGLGFLTMPIFTRILSLEEFGNYNNIISWYSILMTIFTLGLSNSVNRARFDYPDELPGYLSTITLLGTFSTLSIYGIIIIYPDYFSNLFSMPILYIHIIFASLLIAPVINIFLAHQRVQYKYKLTIIITLGISIFSILLSLYLVSVLNNKLTGRIIGQYLPAILIGSGMYFNIIFKGRKFDFKYVKYALIYCLPLIPFSLASTLLGSSDRVMINYYRGFNETALYSLAYTSSIVITLLMTSINASVTPWLFDKMKSKSYTVIKIFTRELITLFSLVAISLMIVAPELLYILGGKEYVIAKYVMPPVIVGSICQFIYSFYINIEMFEKKNISIALITICAAGINIALNLIFIPRFGYIAAALTTLFSYLVMLLLHFNLVRSIKLNNLYDSIYFFKVVIVSIFVAILCIITYEIILARILIIFIYFIVIVFYLNRKKKLILNLIKNI